MSSLNQSYSILLGGRDHTWGGEVASSGDAFIIAGKTRGPFHGNTGLGQDDVWIAKLDQHGGLSWAELLGGRENEWPRDLEIDRDGNILITGSSFGDISDQHNNSSSNRSDAFLAKYSPSGEQLWVKLEGGGNFDHGYGVSSDSEGGIYITGTKYTSSYRKQDAFISKYSPSGVKQWSTELQSNSADYPLHSAISSTGYIYVAGYSGGPLEGQQSNGSYDLFLSKLNLDGQKIWTKLYGTSRDDRATALSLGPDESIYITGTSWEGELHGEPSFGGRDAYVMKLDRDGEHQWTRSFGSAEDDYATDIVFSQIDDSIVIAGATLGKLTGAPRKNSNGYVSFLARYDTNGSLLESKYAGQVGGQALGELNDGHGVGLAINDAGSVLVSNTTSESLAGQELVGQSDALISRFDFPSSLLEELRSADDHALTLSQTKVNENQSVGSILAEIRLEPRSLVTPEYTILSDPNQADATYFTLDGNRLKLAKALNYEEHQSHSITLLAHADGELLDERTFILDIQDINEPITGLRVEPTTLYENAPAGSIAGTIIVTDEDINDTHSFTISHPSLTIDGNNILLDHPITDFWTYQYTGNHTLTYTLEAEDSAGHSYSLNNGYNSTITLRQAPLDVDAITVIKASEGDTIELGINNPRLVNTTVHWHLRSTDPNDMGFSNRLDFEGLNKQNYSIRDIHDNSIQIPAQSSSKLSLTIAEDKWIEGDENFELWINDEDSFSGAVQTHTIKITDKTPQAFEINSIPANDHTYRRGAIDSILESRPEVIRKQNIIPITHRYFLDEEEIPLKAYSYLDHWTINLLATDSANQTHKLNHYAFDFESIPKGSSESSQWLHIQNADLNQKGDLIIHANESVNGESKDYLIKLNAQGQQEFFKPLAHSVGSMALGNNGEIFIGHNKAIKKLSSDASTVLWTSSPLANEFQDNTGSSSHGIKLLANGDVLYSNSGWSEETFQEALVLMQLDGSTGQLIAAQKIDSNAFYSHYSFEQNQDKLTLYSDEVHTIKPLTGLAPDFDHEASALFNFKTELGQAFQASLPQQLILASAQPFQLQQADGAPAVLPPGVQLNLDTFELFGKPTQAGQHSFELSGFNESYSNQSDHAFAIPFSLEVFTPTQTIGTSITGEVEFQAEREFNLPLRYAINPESAHRALSFNLHFDSSRFEFITPQKTSSLHPALAISQPLHDQQDLDNQHSTDQLIQLDLSATELESAGSTTLELGSLQFKSLAPTNEEGYDPITGQADVFNFSLNEAAPHYAFNAPAIALQEQRFNLDVDGDGAVNLYTDGIMIIRRLIGLETCTSGFADQYFSQSGRRSASETDQWLDEAFAADAFDFDQNNSTSLYTDGIQLIRYLINPALLNQSGDLIGANSPFEGNPAGLQEAFAALEPLPS